MKGIVIASNRSGGGKTTVTLGLMQAFKDRGLEVQGYKVGPDYIDPAFHGQITGKASRNLDLFLMGEDGVKASFTRGRGEIAIVEGVMGLYDGKGITSQFSTAHVAKTLELPIVLVITPKAQVATLCAEIRGLMDFENAEIVGVILNNISESYYLLLKAAIEKHCNIEVFGYLPKKEELTLKSRHLGLVQSREIEDLEATIQYCGKLLEQSVDLSAILSHCREVESTEDAYHVEKIGVKTAVALDHAFSFYYKENLELLEELGEVVYFSPLEDKELPSGTDFLYLGGGYPEVFIEELSKNTSMISSIKEALDNGLPCFAECGGLTYLTEQIEGKKVVGFFQGEMKMTKKLQNFGYCTLTVNREKTRLPKGISIAAHEFHKSYILSEEEKVVELEKAMYDGSTKKWSCGYSKKNTFAQYAHVHFFGNMEFLEALVEKKQGIFK